MEIIRGSSPSPYGNKTFHIKHLNSFDLEEIDEKKERYLNIAKEKGIPTIKEKKKDLEKDGHWGEQDEKRIKDLEDFVATMKETKTKVFLEKDISRLEKEITETEIKLNGLIEERNELIGITADYFSEKKVNEHCIFLASYKDSHLKEKLYTEKEFEELEHSDIMFMSKIFAEIRKRFSEANLKRISLSSFFTNMFYLSEDNAYSFYGKPIVELTYNQLDLFSFGRYFKAMISQMKRQPSEQELDDPDEIIKMFNISQSAEKVMANTSDKDNVATTIVGATKKDMGRIGVEDTSKQEGVDLAEEAAKKGGSLSMSELIKLHGL